MTASRKQAEAPEVDFFSGSGFAVGELELSLRDLHNKVRDLKNGHQSRSATQQKLAAEHISKITAQMHALSEVLVRVTLNHINRKPRA